MIQKKYQSQNGYELQTLGDAESFLAASLDFLHQNEDINATVISTAQMIMSGSTTFGIPHWFGAIRDKDYSLAGCAIHAQPDGLTVTEVDAALARPVFEWVSGSGIEPKRITSEPKFTDSISHLWKELRRKEIAMEHYWDVYRLDSVSDECISSATGTLRLARSDESSLVKEWGNWYAREKPAFLNIGDFFQRKLALRELFVWDDNGPTSIMSLSARTRRGIRISALYTPLQFRGKGYASSIVTEVCKRQLSLDREFISLSAQKGDPVERLYTRLGFYPVGQRKSVTFTS